MLPSGDVLATWYTDNEGIGDGAFVWIDASGRSKSWLVPAGQARELEITAEGFLLRRHLRPMPEPPVIPVLVDGEGNLAEARGRVLAAGEQPPAQLGTWESLYLTGHDVTGRRWSAEPFDFDRNQTSRRVTWWWPGQRDQRQGHTVPFFTEVRVVAGDHIAFLGSGTEGLLVDHSADGGRTWEQMTVSLQETLGIQPQAVEFTAVTDDGWAIGNVRERTYLRVNAQDPGSVERVDVPPGFLPPQSAGNLIYCEQLFDDDDVARDLRLAISTDHGDTWRTIDLKGK